MNITQALIQFRDDMKELISNNLSTIASKFTASDINYDGSISELESGTVQDAIDEINEKVPFQFAIDSNGNYGYIKDGADSVTPFSDFKFSVKGQLTTSQYGGETLTLNNCQIGKKYLCIINSWSGSGSSNALTYCKFTSVTGCTYEKLIERPDNNQGAYIVYILTATDTTMVLTPGDAILMVFE